MDKNEHTNKVLAEAYRIVLELDIPEDAPVDMRIWKLTVEVRKARTELAKVQFDLKLKTT